MKRGKKRGEVRLRHGQAVGTTASMRRALPATLGGSYVRVDLVEWPVEE